MKSLENMKGVGGVSTNNDDLSIEWSSHLKIHYPALAEVYLNESAETKINRQFKERNNKLLSKPTTTYSTTFYDLFARVIDNRIGSARELKVAHSLLGQLNGEVQKLLDILSQNSISTNQLKGQMDGLFRLNDAKYLDKVGELLSTNYILENYDHFKLLQLEFKHERHLGKRSKDSDLLLFDKTLNRKVLVDILNINLDHKKIESEEGLSEILSHRIENKAFDKRYTDAEVVQTFGKAVIQPFIWVYDWHTIVTYKEVLGNFSVYNSLPILLLRQRSDFQSQQIYYDCIKASDITN
ncbi:hypothetical protein JMN32_15005 [Fulvivirga sp. 29W222]|uniref:Uncharacterized protein n=1 Tax=Fulvivirga marina TaxID=2494733 RepID=A0A937FWU5_9BACT|nr:hypothetical protein [Fulvivirga marina]MBL6447625.1 hypothetical protein [Fulvivirga marina]